MNILGLILELNPFHNGHKYFIEKAIEETQADLVIAVVSSSFTMRGEISILDKAEKTKQCLSNKIDIVLELPFVYAVNSSDYFAHYAIKILNEFKITHLAFGSELGSLESLKELYALTKSTSYNELVQKELSKGSSYPSSSLKAIINLSKDTNLINNFSLPNNTLALSYLKAIEEINDKIIPYTIKREDNQYFDTQAIEGKLASASSLRNLINNDQNISSFIPNYEYNFIKESEANEQLYQLFKYQLLNKPNFNKIINISEGIENRLYNFINEKNYEDYINNTYTKRYPINRIKRIILHVLANTNKDILDSNETYLRVLGLNSEGIKHIKKLKNKNIIMNTKDALDNASSVIKEILETELKITRIYDLVSKKEIYKTDFILQVNKNDN